MEAHAQKIPATCRMVMQKIIKWFCREIPLGVSNKYVATIVKQSLPFDAPVYALIRKILRSTFDWPLSTHSFTLINI